MTSNIDATAEVHAASGPLPRVKPPTNPTQGRTQSGSCSHMLKSSTASGKGSAIGLAGAPLRARPRLGPCKGQKSELLTQVQH